MATGFIENSSVSDTRRIVIEVEKQFDPAVEASMIRKAIEKVAKEEAERWLEANRDLVINRLNVDAIANMIMLEVATQTKRDILAPKETN
jgi:hypothetical protein